MSQKPGFNVESPETVEGIRADLLTQTERLRGDYVTVQVMCRAEEVISNLAAERDSLLAKNAGMLMAFFNYTK